MAMRTHMPTIAYKSAERRQIVAAWAIGSCMSLGDQWSDLLGDPQADVSVKLPNPFYFHVRNGDESGWPV